LINEVYASTFATAYGFGSIGLRYFNVFGPRQDPEGAYAAVIPKWVAALIKQQQVTINGDGETSRDFCYVDNVVQANLLAATATNAAAVNQAYNIAIGERTTLNELFDLLQSSLRKLNPKLPLQKPKYQDFRAGDIRHSLADISKAQKLLGYAPKYRIAEGIDIALDWYLKNVV
jgi:UDP-N-acetylglucosamine/UDP-N-acetylgalactosamine 4-epimerase